MGRQVSKLGEGFKEGLDAGEPWRRSCSSWVRIHSVCRMGVASVVGRGTI